MKITEGPMLFEIASLPTEKEAREELEKLLIAFKGKRPSVALQSYIFDEWIWALKKRINLTSTRLEL